MSKHGFFQSATSLTVADCIAICGASAQGSPDLTHIVRDIAPIELAGPEDVSFVADRKFAAALETARAGVVLTTARFAPRAAEGVAVLVCDKPYEAFIRIAHRLYPQSLRPTSLYGATGIAPHATVHPSATLGNGVTVDPGAMIGPGAEIGPGALIGPNAVIGPKVRIGSDCAIGGNVTIVNAVLGDRVIIHPGTQIGQDGYGYVSDAGGHTKVPQIGAVVIHDDVEIGANCAIDRGGMRDTVIGQGTKIDNLCQIGHNCVIGRHCIIVAQCGLSGSATLGDFVVLGARVGVIPHIRIGDRAMLAARSSPIEDVPAGETWGGSPAKPIKQFFRELAAIKKLGQGGGRSDG